MRVAVEQKTGLEHENAPVRSWSARLTMLLAERQGKTRLAKKTQVGPLTLQRAHHPEGGLAHLHLLHPPGGVVGGDSLEICVNSDQSSGALITTPGATKFYHGNGFGARQVQNLVVGKDASLEWLPQENIFFNGAQVKMNTLVEVEVGGSLFFWEINCFGRPAAARPFIEGSVSNRMKVQLADRLVLNEVFVHNAERDSLNAATGLRGMNTMATLLAFPIEDQVVSALVQETDQVGVSYGATCMDELLVVRCLGHSAEQVRRLLESIWVFLRPSVLQRPAVPPRIWQT